MHDSRDRHDSAPTWSPDEGHPRRKMILAIMCGSLILVVASVSSLNVAIPAMVRALDATQTEQLWILDAYALVFAGLLLPAGALGDRFGRRLALLLGLAVFGAAALLATLAGSPSQLIALRGVMGIGAAAIMPATLSIITTVFPAHERGKAIAAWAGFAGAGGAIGPIASGLLLERFWWGSVFFINVPIIAIIVAGVIWVVPETRTDHASAPLDPVGAVLSIVGLGSIVLAIIEGPQWGWTSGRTLGVFALGAATLTVFVLFELRSQNPMLDPRLFRIRRFAIGALTITNAFMVMFGMFYVITLYLQFVMGHSALGAAVRVLPFAATMILIAPRSPLIVGRLGARRVIAMGFVIQAIGLALAATFGTTTPYWELAAAFVLLALGMALMMPPTTEAIVSSLPAAKAGVGSAVNDTTREVGGAIGIALLGSLLSTGYRSGLGSVTDLLPEPAQAIARDSIGGALAVARDLGGEQSQGLVAAAREAYTDGMGLAFTAAVAISLATAAIVFAMHPDRDAPVRRVVTVEGHGA